MHSQHPSAHKPRSCDPEPGDTVFGVAMVPGTAELCHSSWPPLQSNFNSSILQLQIPFLHRKESDKKATQRGGELAYFQTRPHCYN